MAESTYELTQLSSPSLLPGGWEAPVAFIEARRVLSEQLSDPGGNPARLRQATERYLKVMEEEIVGPLLAIGGRQGNRVLGAVQIEFANLTALLLAQGPYLQRELVQASSLTGQRGSRGKLDPEFNRHMQLVDRIIRLGKLLMG